MKKSDSCPHFKKIVKKIDFYDFYLLLIESSALIQYDELFYYNRFLVFLEILAYSSAVFRLPKKEISVMSFFGNLNLPNILRY